MKNYFKIFITLTILGCCIFGLKNYLAIGKTKHNVFKIPSIDNYIKQNGVLAPSIVKKQKTVGVKITKLSFIKNIVTKSMEAGDNSITFNIADIRKITFNAFSNKIDEVINGNPEIRYFNKWNTSASTIGNNGTYKVEFTLNFTKEQILLMEKVLKIKISQIVSKRINSTMSDYEKELKLHDYIVNNTVYDYKNVLNSTIPNISYTAYGVLVNGIGVCEGYSYAIKRLLHAVGITSEVVVGDVYGDSSGPHAWNIVKLGKSYYQLDATFDDPIVNNGTENILSHKYFNITDAEISKNHTWQIGKYPICNNTTYKYKGY